MRSIGSRRRRFSLIGFLLLGAICTGFGLLMLTMRSVDPSSGFEFPDVTSLDEPFELAELQNLNESFWSDVTAKNVVKKRELDSCATVEEMGKVFADDVGEESLRVRKIIQHHFSLHGASRVRELPPEQFCRQGFVLGKASEAGFGNEMYKILTAGALSILLNRSLIIGQTRGRFPFGEYIVYTNHSFTLKEVKHLWRKNDCVSKYGRRLIMRTDDFEKPAETNVLCSNWRKWKQPIIWFQGTTDAVAAQFFLKNIHSEMRKAATNLFGQPKILNRPNVFGELMRVIISPSKDVEESVNWALHGGLDPDIAIHMRMLMNRPIRAMQAALNCTKRSFLSYQHHEARPRVVLVSDTPSFIKDISPYFQEFAEVIHFDYKLFKGNISGLASSGEHQLSFRAKDWGPAPRWVAFVDFFLASRAKHAVVSGAHRRVGTTYAQLIAALAEANQLVDFSTSRFSFFSSFHSNLLSEGLGNQVGWGHVWNRFAGSLSCRNQPNQCAHTPLLPPAWWDGSLQSPIPRDIRRMEAFGVLLSVTGEVNESHLLSFCSKRKNAVKTLPVFHQTS